MSRFPLFPEAASTLANSVDTLFFVWLAIAGLVSLVVAALIVWFAVKYRRGSKANRQMKSGALEEREEHGLELAWILLPLVIFLSMFIWAAKLYYVHAAAPPDAMEIYVVGKQWMWKLQHSDGRREINELHVPVGRAVKLVMISEDVIHDFSVPVFRIKQDVLPGRYTSLWFAATKAGDYRLFCSQYCGTDHARMIGHVVAMEPAAFQRWLTAGNEQPGLVEQGATLFRKYGCSGCHGANTSVQAPRLDALYGAQVELADGSSVIADERYIYDSVMLPDKEIVAGYPAIMPSYQGQIGEEDLIAIVKYIKSLRGPSGGDKP